MANLANYNLGELIDAKVQAVNTKGYSVLSDPTSSVVYYQGVPQQAVTGITGVSSQTSITLSWLPLTGAVPTGYSPIIGYDIYMDSGSGFGSVIQTATSTSSVSILATITSSTTYTFKIIPRNIFGSGPSSSLFSIVAADLPDQPVPPVLSQNGTVLKISFSTPLSNGSPVSSFMIKFLNKTDNSYYEYKAYCNGSSSIVINTLQC